MDIISFLYLAVISATAVQFITLEHRVLIATCVLEIMVTFCLETLPSLIIFGATCIATTRGQDRSDDRCVDRVSCARFQAPFPPEHSSILLTEPFFNFIYDVRSQSSWSSRQCVGLLDIKPGFELQARHQNKIQKVFLRRFSLSRFVAKTLSVKLP